MQVVKPNVRQLVRAISASTVMIAAAVAWADEPPQTRHHQTDVVAQERSCKTATQDSTAPNRFEGVQVETSDIGLFENFFETLLQAPLVQRADHPQADRLRGYCYRGVLVVVRQDLRTTRPTGWVQLNFRVPDVAAVQDEIERVYKASSVFQLAAADRVKIVRFRFKPDVMRGDRKVARFEVGGPEGFMIGFDQTKDETSRDTNQQIGHTAHGGAGQ
jgi:hypothetical protein